MCEEVLSVGEPREETFVDLTPNVINHGDHRFRATDPCDPLVEALVSFAHGCDRTSAVRRRSGLSQP